HEGPSPVSSPGHAMKHVLVLLIRASWSSCVLGAEEIDFARDVRPILEQHCYRCHGPDDVNGDLRLDAVSSMLSGGASGPALVPGKSGASLLVKAITGADDV